MEAENKNRRIVVKVGTSTLMRENGSVNIQLIDKLARVLSDIHSMGHEVILVSSGAIGVGTNKLGLSARPTELGEKQAVAAVGQCELIHLYDKLFGEYGQTVGQILLTDSDVESDYRRESLERTFETLLSMGIIPVVNENDSVSSSEIETGHTKVLGDNDTLSAIVAVLCKADILILLSDIDGLFDGDPRTDPGARLVREVREITDSLRAMAGKKGSQWGTGGMLTKLDAGMLAMENGLDMVITNGQALDGIYDILEEKPVGTRFISERR